MKKIIIKFIVDLLLSIAFFIPVNLVAQNLVVSNNDETRVFTLEQIQQEGSQDLLVPSPFNYTFQMEFAFNNNNGIELPVSIDMLARKLNGHLGLSRFFDTRFIRDEKLVRDYCIKHALDRKSKGQLVTAKTEDGFDIECTYFDRGGSRLLIVFEGFTNCREYMIPFVHMFDQEGEKEGIDILLVDFRGHGFRPFKIFDFASWNLNLAKRTFGINSIDVTLGRTEHHDIFAVVDHFKKVKKYKQVYGLGLCYGAFVLAKAQGLRSDLFDKIILDGCWESLLIVLKRMTNDPKLLWDPQRGGFEATFPFKHNFCKSTMLWLAQKVWGLDFHDVTLLDYLPKITETPVLFFYGKDDLLVGRESTERLWHSLDNPNKAIVITSNSHVRNHLKQKELYKLICDLFLDLPFDQFIQVTCDLDRIKQHCVDKLLTS